MDTDEALDLLLCLPMGSLWRGSRWPEHAWAPERHDLADIKDLIQALIWCQGGYGDRERPPQVRRPKSREATEAEAKERREAEERRARVAEALRTTTWEEA